MIQTVAIKLEKLICTKSQEQVDEPYLWAFYFKLDGTNIKQDLPSRPLSLNSTIKIVTPAGSAGNLGSTLSSGQSLSIPPFVGEFSTPLTDIHLKNLPLIGNGELFIPPMICCLVALIEEDAVPVYAMENAHNEVRSFFEQEVNQFIQDLDLWNVVKEADIMAGLPLGAIPTAQQIKDYLRSEVNKLQAGLKPQVKSLIISSVINSISNIGDMISAISDPDDNFGTATIFYNIPEIINSSLNSSFAFNFKNAGGDYDYTLTGYVNLHLSPQHPELHQYSTVLSSSANDSGNGIITDAICLKDPVNVAWTKIGNKEEQDIWWDFTSGNLRWTIENIQLTEGQVSATGVIDPFIDTWNPVFNGGNAPDCYTSNYLKQKINLGYQLTRVNNVPHIKLYNDPADGNYSLAVSLELLLPNGSAVLIDQLLIDFDGDVITIPDDIKQTLENCHNIYNAARWISNKRFTHVHQVTPKEIWGPYNRILLQNNIAKKLNEYAVENEINSTVVEGLLTNIRQKFNTGISYQKTGNVLENSGQALVPSAQGS